MARTPRSVQSESFLEAALEGLELRRKRVEEEIQQVRSLLGRRGRGRPPKTAEDTQVAAPPRKRRLNPDARKRIAAAQKKRWAEYRKKQAASEH